MKPDVACISDPQRLASLRQTMLLDTPAEEAFDRITRLTAKLLGAPVALISLVDADRQFLKSCVGLPAPFDTARQTPLTHSFCRHVVTSGRTFCVNDARNDPRVRDNLAAKDLNVIAYLGAPLTGPGGHVIGALCAIDSVSRQWTQDQEKTIGELAGFVVAEIGSRRAVEVERSAQAALNEALEQLRLKEAEANFEAQFRFLADAMPQMVWTSAPDGGGVDYYNQRWFAYTGMTFEQTRERGWEPVVHPDDLPACNAAVAASKSSGQTMEQELRLRRASDGAYRWHLARSVPMRDSDGNIVRWVGTSTDIHDQKTNDITERAAAQSRLRDAYASLSEAHSALRQSEERFHTFMDYSPAAAFIKDEHCRFLYVNRRFAAMFNQTPRDMIGKFKDEFQTRECAALAHESDRLVLETGQPVEREALPPFPCGDQGRWIMLKFPLKATDGNNLIGGIAFDVSAAKKAEAAADAANLAKSEFLANMSHEIRTPMTAIMGYTDLLDDPTQSPRQRRQHVNVIRRNGQHLLELLGDILDLSKIEAGEMTVESVECNPAELLHEVETLMRPRAMAGKITLRTRVTGALPATVFSDPTRLRQILLNLVGNAVKFTQQGGVTIDAAMEKTDAGGVLRFDVSDTGIGIAAHHQAKLFHPFRQADGSTTRKFGGTGLGLAICKRLANMLGGQLTLVSEEGVGSTFTLVLPVQLPAKLPAGTPSATGTPPPTVRYIGKSDYQPARLTGKILVAEDGIDTQRLAELYLEAAGLSVETAPNGKIAVDMVVHAEQTGKPYDVVLMDMQMPELDGYDATARLRAAGFARLPIIAFTAHAMPSERQACLQSGCNDHVTKPIDRKNLIGLIAKYLPAAQITAGTILRSEKASDPLISTILGEYIQGLPEQVGKIGQQLARADLRALRLLMHQLKGSGGSYGFPEITTRARNAEAAIAGKEPMNRIVSEVQSLMELIRRVEGYDRARETAINPDAPAGPAASAASGPPASALTK
jgi:PAS domain S-box-containing protein